MLHRLKTVITIHTVQQQKIVGVNTKEINGTNLYKPGKGFHPDVIKHVKPEYIKLSDETELSKCRHAQTQNANESFNSLIWERAPKIRYCGLLN